MRNPEDGKGVGDSTNPATWLGEYDARGGSGYRDHFFFGCSGFLFTEEEVESIDDWDELLDGW